MAIMQPTMIETPALSLPQRLKAATAEQHRRVERSGVMATLLRGRIERLAYLALLRNLHALYAALEPALSRQAAHPAVGPVVVPELFRRDALESDLRALQREADPPAEVLRPATVAYVERLREIEATQPELLVAHAYVRYLGDLSGGQHLRRIVRRALALQGAAGTCFYDFGDTSQMTPLVQMYTLGHAFMPAPIHAGGLRYHGMASSICELYRNQVIEARAVQQLATFEAGVLFARAEGIVPAPEANHAVRGAIDEAIRCREEGKAETIAFNLCGHGHFDMASYEKYFAGKLVDYELPQAEIDRAVAALPKV